MGQVPAASRQAGHGRKKAQEAQKRCLFFAFLRVFAATSAEAEFANNVRADDRRVMSHHQVPTGGFVAPIPPLAPASTRTGTGHGLRANGC
jgi:hypothetical protein